MEIVIAYVPWLTGAFYAGLGLVWGTRAATRLESWGAITMLLAGMAIMTAQTRLLAPDLLVGTAMNWVLMSTIGGGSVQIIYLIAIPAGSLGTVWTSFIHPSRKVYITRQRYPALLDADLTQMLLETEKLVCHTRQTGAREAFRMLVDDMEEHWSLGTPLPSVAWLKARFVRVQQMAAIKEEM